MRGRHLSNARIAGCAQLARKAWRCLLIALATCVVLSAHVDAQRLISASSTHTCALTATSNAGVYCWGSNFQGQLGDGTTTQRTAPVAVSGLSSGVASVGTGQDFSCALLTTGEVRCWGSNVIGQLGNPNYGSSSTPVTVLNGSGYPLTGVASLSVGGSHACVIFNSGGAQCWGAGFYGQLGTGNNSNTIIPTDVSGFTSNVEAIAAGLWHTCLVSISPNRIHCFGRNADYQLGDGTGIDSNVPVLVSGLSNAAEVSAGDAHSCARFSIGDTICWGTNSQGELGVGDSNSYLYPVTSGLSFAARLTAGRAHSCATDETSRSVYCWGRGAEGQIGDGALLERNSPVTTSPLVSGVIDITAGALHSCAWMGACSAKCWGSNTDGQLGDGTTTNRTTPTSITFCTNMDPTPTPTPTSTPTPLPDACASESSCVPNDRLTTPLDPKPPEITVVPTTSKVTLKFTRVRLGIPTDLARRTLLAKKLSKFLKRKITNLSGAIRSLKVYLDVSIKKAPRISSNWLEPLASRPTKYKTQTRNRRVTTRLAPGTYVAKVTVRLKDSRGRTFKKGAKSRQVRFTVR